MKQNTRILKFTEINHKWYLIDAKKYILGRLATKIANILSGKDKLNYTPNLDNGDYVVVINAGKVIMTKDKAQKKKYYSHSGYPGGFKVKSASDYLRTNPCKILEKAVFGMLAKNKLRAIRIKRLRLFPGENHIHQAQKLIVINKI